LGHILKPAFLFSGLQQIKAALLVGRRFIYCNPPSIAPEV
jgi:hypothetical protein